MNPDCPNPNEPPKPYSFDYYIRTTAQLGMMVAVLMLCADIGFAQAQQYELQGTANMAAIVAAHQLPNDDAAVKAAAAYMRSNGVPNPENHVVVTGSDMVTVDLDAPYNTMFAKWLGIKRVPLRAYAQEQRF